MKRIRKITESDLKRLVKKVISEETVSEPPQVVECSSLMKSKPGMTGGGSSVQIPSGAVTLKSRGSVSPEYQGIDVIVDGKKFCFIPKTPR